MQALVRPAEPSDTGELVSMMDAAAEELIPLRGGQALLRSQRGTSTSAEIISAAFLDSATMVWCASWEHVIVGYAIARLDVSDEIIASLSDIYTTPDARDIGVGEILLESALAWAIAHEATAIDAQTLPGARESKNLFERFGLTARLLTVRRELR